MRNVFTKFFFQKLSNFPRLLDRITECLTMILNCGDITISDRITEEEEVVDKAPYRIHGFIITLVERLDEEFTKLLKECDPHSNEYVQRLKDETRVVEIIDKVQTFLEKQGKEAELCSVYMRKIEHLYYKFDPMVLKQKQVISSFMIFSIGSVVDEKRPSFFRFFLFIIKDTKLVEFLLFSSTSV